MVELYTRYHLDAQKGLDDNRCRTKVNHGAQYTYLERMLGFQHYLHMAYIKFRSGFEYDRFTEAYSREMVAEMYFHMNAMYMQASLRSLEQGLIHPYFSNMRSVHEAIPKMYYMSVYPGEAWDVLESEIPVYGNNDFPDFIRTMRDLDGAASNHARNPELKKTMKPRSRYRPVFFRDALYEGKIRIAIEQMYSGLSSSVHPNLVRNMAGTSYDRGETDMLFGLLKTLSYFNIAAYLEGAAVMLQDLDVEEETICFLRRMESGIKTVIGGAAFFPNKRDPASRLKYRVGLGVG